MAGFGSNCNLSCSIALAPKSCDILSFVYCPSPKLMQLQPKPGLLGDFHQVEKPFLRLETAKWIAPREPTGSVAIRWPQPQLWSPKEITHAAVGCTCHSLEPVLASEHQGPTGMRTAATSNWWASKPVPMVLGGCSSQSRMSPSWSTLLLPKVRETGPWPRTLCLRGNSPS